MIWRLFPRHLSFRLYIAFLRIQTDNQNIKENGQRQGYEYGVTRGFQSERRFLWDGILGREKGRRGNGRDGAGSAETE